jgi:hypothetical protein
MMSTAELRHQRNDLVTEYNSTTGAGKKAGLARKLGQVELDLVLAGAVPGTADEVKDKDHAATFTPWENPTAARTTRTPIAEDQIVADLKAAHPVLTNAAMPDTIRNAADTRIGSLLRAAEVRGYKVTDPRKPAKIAA